MPNAIKIKRSNTAGAVPATLADGEIAINQADKYLYYRDSAGVVQVFNLTKIPPAVLTNPVSVAETIVARWALPANYITNKMAMQAVCTMLSTGTGTVAFKLRIGATGTITDTLVTTLTTSGAQVVNGRGRATFEIYMPTATTVQAHGNAIMQSAILGTVASANITATIAPSALVYVSITATVATAITMLGARLTVNS